MLTVALPDMNFYLDKKILSRIKRQPTDPGEHDNELAENKQYPAGAIYGRAQEYSEHLKLPGPGLNRFNKAAGIVPPA
jgi:hypothetical protein